MNKKTEETDFIEFMDTVSSVKCQGKGCDKSASVRYCDEYDFAKALIKKKWKISSKWTLYCPNCAKKFLKKVK